MKIMVKKGTIIFHAPQNTKVVCKPEVFIFLGGGFGGLKFDGFLCPL